MLENFNATYAIDEGVVRIISKDNQNDPEFLRLKMFDCRALSKALPKPAQKPLVLFMNGGGGGGGFGGGGGWGGGGGGGGGVFCVSPLQQSTDDDDKDEDTATKNVSSEKLAIAYEKYAAKLDQHLKSQKEPTGEDTLLRLVYSMANPDGWETNGVGNGQAEVVNGVLVVTQDEAGLRKIDQLLIDLRGQVLRRAEPVSAIKRAVKPIAKVARRGQDQKGFTDDPFDGPEDASDPFDAEAPANDPFAE